MRILIPLVTVLVLACSGESGAGTDSSTPVAAVDVAPNYVVLVPGATAQLIATVKGAGGTTLVGRQVSWGSTAPAVATVSTSGVVSAVAPGTASITATSEGFSARTTVTVILAAVATIAVAPTRATISEGSTLQLTATLQDAGGRPLAGRNVIWTTDRATVATVSDAGLVSAVGPGVVTITASCEGITASASLTVSAEAVAQVSISPSGGSVSVGATLGLTATIRNTANNVMTGRVVTWSSSQPAIASVSATGVVTGIGPGGPVIIYATCEGVGATVAVTVIGTPVASLTITPTQASISVGTTLALTATTRDAGNRVLEGRLVMWKSSAPDIATVSTAGVVTGIALGGPVAITATSEGISTGVAVTVVGPKPVASVWVDPLTSTLTPGRTVQLHTIIEDADFVELTNRPVTWASSDPAVATVSAAGLVTAVAVGGPVTITASSEGKTGSARVTVAPPPPPPAPPPTSTVIVTTVTSGADQDPDGYDVVTNLPSADQPWQATAIESNGTLTLSRVGSDPFPLKISLTDFDPNCTVANQSRALTLAPGATLTVTFAVTCQPRSVLAATDTLAGVWRALHWEVFRDSALTSRMVDLISNVNTGTLILGPSTNGLARWQWRDLYNNGIDVVSAGPMTVASSSLLSDVEFEADMMYCCGFENNSPIPGRQAFLKVGDQLVISSLASIVLYDDFGQYTVWTRLTLQRIR